MDEITEYPVEINHAADDIEVVYLMDTNSYNVEFNGIFYFHRLEDLKPSSILSDGSVNLKKK